MLPLVLAIVAGSATRTPLPAFAGVTLGETARQLVAERGDPLGEREEPGEAVYLYLTPDGNVEQFVHIKAGRVVAVGASSAPPRDGSVSPPAASLPSAFGVALGDPATSVAAIRKDRFVRTDQTPDGPSPIYSDNHGLFYAFLIVKGNVAQITASMSHNWIAFLGPGTASPAIHGGTSVADAIAIKAANEEAGVRAEYAYLALHSCDPGGTGKWIAPQQSRVTNDGKPYDKIGVRCSVNNAARDFYFEIGSFLGKS